MMTFLTPISSPVGGSTAGIAVGDYNSDGLSDMAVVNQTTSSINMLLSNGDGSFRAGGVYAAGATVYDAAFGDFNGDGLGDVATAGTNGSVNILLGDGVGGLSAPTAYGAGLGAHSVVAADFNNDGRLDVATMNSSTSSVLLGNGDGTFQARQDTAIPGNSTNAVVGDFNRDGNLDLVAGTRGSAVLEVLVGDGRGWLQQARPVVLGGALSAMAAADVDRDSVGEVAVAIESSVQLLSSTRGIMAASSIEIARADSNVNALLFAQLDNGFALDLALATDRSVSVVRGNEQNFSGAAISSTLLDFLVHPALFWCFGRRDAEEQMTRAEEDPFDVVTHSHARNGESVQHATAKVTTLETENSR